EREVGYGITDLWDEIVETLQGAPDITDTDLGGYRRGCPEKHGHERPMRVTLFMVRSYHYAVLGQISEIRELQAADRRRQTVISELLRLEHRRSTETSESRTALQGQITALHGQLPSASCIEDRPEVTLPPQKRLDITLGPRYEVEESSSAAAARPAGGFREDYGFFAAVDREIMRDPEREVGYGITDSWDEIVETLQGAPVSTDTELGGYVREFESRVRQDMDEIYTRLDDEQTGR
nr:hypothetical protein [Tanacetum cinerariifolium]